ncbi:type I DNA topoisomerase [Pseudoclavibacter sp. 13-3]|uniref:type I DNA topoisomerase n=1 Tax=Pseudoclavibacter sp. 13-3 TaxID=2901228 RepID=UPI001E508C2C|nr:type I DNA topoisomerase [Pseudoclavibacter sp. 13-3]
MAHTKRLVIVESPAKAKTIGKYLGEDYTVLASVGHVRDLIEPKNLPPELKKGSLGKFSVDVDHGFEPYYEISSSKKKTVAELRRALKGADELYLATDEDREGEAIAWHLLQVLKPKVPVRRMVFHEITKEAITKAKEATRELNTALVDAQETRRILDRLYGYEISPVLWRKVGPGLSAGRVQSAATRLVVDRERERIAFRSAEYWDVVVEAKADADETEFEARLVSYNGVKIATGRDFSDRGELKTAAHVLTGDEATALTTALESARLEVASVESKPYRRRPAAPFTTSTLQQEAARKLRFSARQTMSLAQGLYENGYITYMRTDSPILSHQAVTAARAQAKSLYGENSVPEKPRVYTGKSKNAQEAHEAIRPSGDHFRLPNDLRSSLRADELKLYDLIWKRTVASQMADATGSTATATLRYEGKGVKSEFTASGTVITFRGFLDAYEEGRDADRHAAAERAARERRLPALAQGQFVSVIEPESKQHETLPPPRYTEASLVKTLEELGIGRPSTYAAIISTIVDRGYVTPKGQSLVPTWVAFSVVRLLEQHFASLVDYDFTAGMEGDLDRIAAGQEDRRHWLSQFYFGEGDHPGLRSVIDNLGEIDARGINSTPITDAITLRMGKFGPYLEQQIDGEETPKRVSLPDGLEPDELTAEKAVEIMERPSGDRELGVNPESGHAVVVKAGRFGPYVTETLPEGEEWPKGVKPPTASLFRSMEPATVDLAVALKLLSLPRVVGEVDDVPVEALNGRYGPYLKHGKETRSLPDEDSIFSIDLEKAKELLAQPKYGGRRAAAPPLREFDKPDPVSEKPIVVKNGRFGPYVTDGEINATVPKAENAEELTFERAVELLAIKREKGPAKKRTRKAPAKKTPAKKTTARKTAAKKTTASKSATAKSKTATAKKTATTKSASAKPTAAKKAATAGDGESAGQ